MGRPVVGLDIGTSGVRAAELVLGRGGARLDRFAQIPLPPGAVRDGEVVDPEVVGDALRQLWAQAKFSTRKVVVGVANQKVVVRQIELPSLPPNELKTSLGFQVQDFIPMPVEQSILDFHPLEEFTGDNGARMMRLLLVAASRDMVIASLEALGRARLVPTRVDLTSFAVLRSLAHEQSGWGDVQAEALVDIGASVTNIVVHQAGVPRFVRILLMGGSDITGAVAERLGVPMDQAEFVKRANGMAALPGTGDTQPGNRAIESAGGAFVEEVRGSLDYYVSQPGAVRLGRVVLSGGGALLAGLPERLAAATRLPVELAHPLALLKLGKTGLSDEELLEVEQMVSVPVGLALAATT